VASDRDSFSQYSPQHRVDRLIAGGRLALTGFAVLAVVVDPAEPARNAHTVFGLVAAYALYALVVAWLAWAGRRLSEGVRIATHVLDVGLAIALLCFTHGSQAFFAFIVFPLLSATRRWRWRGILWTGISAFASFVTVFLTLGPAVVASHQPQGLNTFIIQGAYLVIVTIMLGYVGAHVERGRRERATLASWTNPSVNDRHGLVAALLRHAASVLDAPRVLIAWQAADDPGLNLAQWTGTEARWAEEPDTALEPLVAEPFADTDLICSDAAEPDARVLCVAGARSWRRRGMPLGPQLQSTFEIRAVIALRLRSVSVRGRLFILDKPAATSDHLVLAAIVARQVENAFEHDYMVRRVQHAAVGEERARVARDVHDGVLQSLTGMALRLAAIRQQLEKDPATVRGGLQELQNLILLQQRELRALIRELQTGAATHCPFGDVLTEVVLRFEQDWALRVTLQVEPQAGRLDALIPHQVVREIPPLLREALFNVARHSLASSVHLHIAADGSALRITVSDNGQGFPFRGRLDHTDLAERNLGPVMLRQRITALGGSLAIESSDTGARLEIVLPCRAASRPGVQPPATIRPFAPIEG
jgi:signal transduction histidine kinase